MLENIGEFSFYSNILAIILLTPLLISAMALKKWMDKQQNQPERLIKVSPLIITINAGMALQIIGFVIINSSVDLWKIQANNLAYLEAYLFLSLLAFVYIVFLWIVRS